MVRHAVIAAFVAITTLTAEAPTLTTVTAYHKAVNSSQPCVIMVTGAHCGPCHIMKPHFDSIALTDSDIACYMIDTSCTALRPILRQLNVMTIPTLICCHEGKVYHRCNGGLTMQGIRRVIQDFHAKRRGKKHLQSALLDEQKTQKRPVKSPVKADNKKPAAKPQTVIRTSKPTPQSAKTSRPVKKS